MTIRAKLASQAAIYEPAGPGGDGPYTDPLDYPAETLVHDAYDYFANAEVTSVPITHAAVPAASAVVVTYGLVSISTRIAPNVADVLLVAHNKGYPPSFLVALDGEEMPLGMPVQTNSGAMRRVLPYATDTEIRMKVISDAYGFGLPALSVTYDVVVFPDSVADPDAPSFYLSPSRVRLAHDRIDSDRPALRLAKSGESEFQLPLGPTIGLGDGFARWVTPAGTVYDGSITNSPNTYTYSGSFAGSAALPVIVR